MRVPLLAPIDYLGKEVAAGWARVDFNEGRLPELAAAALERSSALKEVTQDDIIKWIVSSEWLPPQVNLESNFAEPPVALFWHPKFYIEALFWTTGTPAVHEHGFCGAFGVLEGSSLQTRFEFKADRRVNSQMVIGDIAVKDVSLLERGDIELIRSGSDLIHSVFHLDTPSVTLVVRTPTSFNAGPQYVYYRPHVAVNERHNDPESIRRVQIIEYLDKLDSERFEDVTTLALRQSDLYGTFRILQYLRLSPRGLARFDDWLEIGAEAHKTDIPRLRRSLEELDRGTVLRALRRRVTSPEHRFLLALLMNLQSRESIFDVIGARFRTDDPKSLVARWAFELSGLEICGIEFNEVNQTVFLDLIDGLSLDDVVRRLEEKYEIEDELQRTLVADHCGEMRRNAVFAPLFGGHSSHAQC